MFNWTPALSDAAILKKLQVDLVDKLFEFWNIL